MMNILFLFLLQGIMLTSGIEADTSTSNDFIACLDYLNSAELFTKYDMNYICNELITTGKYIDPNFQDRGLVIHWMQLGDTVRFELI